MLGQEAQGCTPPHALPLSNMVPIFTTRKFRSPDGLTLTGDVAGPAGAPVVALLHGGGQTRHAWRDATRVLAASGYRVVNLDARGHGDSNWPADGRYTLDVLAADLRAVLAEFPGPYAIVGASMGGVTALELAASNTVSGIVAIVMVDIVPRVEQVGSERIEAFMRANPDGFATLEEAADAVAAYNPFRPRPHNPAGLMTNLRRRDNGRLYWHWDARLIDGPYPLESQQFGEPLLAASRRVRVPVMLVRGLRSDIVSDAGIEEFRRSVPHLEVYEVERAGHMVVGDRNDAFNEGAFRFLDRVMPLS